MWAAENRPRYNRDNLRYPSDLTDAEWALIEPLIAPGKPVKGKKRHVLVDTQGLPPRGIVTAADVQDRDGGLELLATVLGLFPLLGKLFADSAYRGPVFHRALEILANPGQDRHRPGTGRTQPRYSDRTWPWRGGNSRSLGAEHYLTIPCAPD